MTVYCKLQENKEKSAVYKFGIYLDELNGLVEFFDDSFRIITDIDSLPFGGKYPLSKLYAKYKMNFQRKQFPNAMSFESG